MPLDVQPLSTRRRIIGILVMAALLAASLGLAQGLVTRRGRRPQLRIAFPPPPGVDTMPVNDSPEVHVQAIATWPQGERQFMAFFWEYDRQFDAGRYLQFLMDQVLAVTPVQAITLRPAEIAGYPAWEGERKAGKGDSAVFAIIRLAVMEDHLAAFCLSGEGGMTDADKQFLDDYCTRQIRVRMERPR